MLNQIWKILFSGLLAICLVMGRSMQDSAIGQPGLKIPRQLGDRSLTVANLQEALQLFGDRVCSTNH
jgi:hypothetical protein